MKGFFLRLALLAFFLVVSVAVGQNPPGDPNAPKQFVPTEVQDLRLKVKYKDAQLAQRDFQEAQQRVNAAIKLVQDEAEKIIKENNWPDGVQYNLQTQTFVLTPKPPAPTPAAQPSKQVPQKN